VVTILKGNGFDVIDLGVDVPADRCLLEWTAELPGGWEPVPEAQLHRAEPPEIFAYLVPLPEPIRHRFFRIRLLE